MGVLDVTPAQAALLTEELRRLRIAVEDAVDRLVVVMSSVAHYI